MNEEQQIGYDSQDSVGKFTHICHFKRADGNKREKVKKNMHSFSYQGTFSLNCCGISYIHESDSSIFVLPQTHMIKCRELSR